MNGYISPSAILDEKVQIAPSARIWHFSHVRTGSILLDQVSIGENCYIGPNTLIGNGSKIQNGAQLHDLVTLEDGVFIGPNTVITNDKKPRAISRTGDQFSTLQWEKTETRICMGASIGANSVIVSPVIIGEWSMIGAGSVVTKDVPAHSLYAGNPARFLYWVGFKGEKLVVHSDGWRSPDSGELFQLDKHAKGLKHVQ